MSKLKLLAILLLSIVTFACAKKGKTKTKLIEAKRTGVDKLTLKCQFKVDTRKRRGKASPRWQHIDKKVTWQLNGESVEGFPHFIVTSYYKENKELFESSLRVVRPEILLEDYNWFSCQLDDVIHDFDYVEGTYLSTIAPYYGTYRFDRNAHKYKFDKAAVKKICKSWNTEFIGRNCAPKGEFGECGCRMRVFEAYRTMEEHQQIKPEPFISFRIMDNLNIPDTASYNLTVSEWPSDETVMRIYDYKNKEVHLTEGLKPEQHYSVEIVPNRPFQPRSSWGITLYVTSSSVVPGKPKITEAKGLGDECWIRMNFPKNVDIHDTYTDFDAQFFVDGEAVKKIDVWRRSDEDFVIPVERGSKVQVRVVGAVEGHSSELSGAVQCN